MTRFRSTSLAMLAVACFSTARAAPADDTVDSLPDGAAWLRHASQDLLPYWRQPTALGSPHGRFPTFRCNDGRLVDTTSPCPELAAAPAWIKSELGRHYVRMQSRQTFAYAIGFHLTGDPDLLAHAQAGASDIRRRALDPATGSAATYFDTDQRPQPGVGERTTQDLAYAGLALASTWYLTRDAGTLADLDRLHRHLMSHFDIDKGQLRWTLKGSTAERAELVAQLDPLNAYMVLVTPLLEGEQAQRWRSDMRLLVRAITRLYCAGDKPRCQGTLGPGSDEPGARHNDYGHSGKAFWMVLLAARQLDEPALAAWARDKGAALLREAYLPDDGAWSSRWLAQGRDLGKPWWIYAELDQLASTLALDDPGHARYLARTWPYWLDHFVDPTHGEVHGWVSAAGDGAEGLKQHHWKNGYHSLEHALLGYLTAQALKGRPVTLHYALKADTAARLQPYLYSGREIGRKSELRAGTEVLTVNFDLPRPGGGRCVGPC